MPSDSSIPGQRRVVLEVGYIRRGIAEQKSRQIPTFALLVLSVELEGQDYHLAVSRGDLLNLARQILHELGDKQQEQEQ